MPDDIVAKINPIYLGLTKDNELGKCLHGKASNNNESLNSTIWERVPKFNFVSLSILEFGDYNAVAAFNVRIKLPVLVSEKLVMVPGLFRINFKQKVCLIQITE